MNDAGIAALTAALTIVGEKIARAQAALPGLGASHQAVSVVAAGLPDDLRASIRADLNNGLLAQRWEAAKQDARDAGLSPDEIEVAALSVVLAQLAATAGDILTNEATRLHGEQRFAEGQLAALKELAVEAAEVFSPLRDTEPPPADAPVPTPGATEG